MRRVANPLMRRGPSVRNWGLRQGEQPAHLASCHTQPASGGSATAARAARPTSFHRTTPPPRPVDEPPCALPAPILPSLRPSYRPEPAARAPPGLSGSPSGSYPAWFLARPSNLLRHGLFRRTEAKRPAEQPGPLRDDRRRGLCSGAPRSSARWRQAGDRFPHMPYLLTQVRRGRRARLRQRRRMPRVVRPTLFSSLLCLSRSPQGPKRPWKARSCRGKRPLGISRS